MLYLLLDTCQLLGATFGALALLALLLELLGCLFPSMREPDMLLPHLLNLED